MFDIDFGLAAAERQRENDLPHKKTLYQCFFCGDDICEGEECYYQSYSDVWICFDCIQSTYAED